MSTLDPIVPRKGLDFDLEGDIPRHWLGGDPFRTRVFDAVSVLFPEGEKYFIRSVQRYARAIDDPELRAAVAAFGVQEGQHHAMHAKYNDRLRDQGVDVDRHEAFSRRIFARMSKSWPAGWALAHTAGAEHLTAILAHALLENDVLGDGDARVRALYVWHGIEELEHKAVAFDVMERVARVPRPLRLLLFVQVLLVFPVRTAIIVEHMLRVDGFGAAERGRLWAGGLRWLFGASGPFEAMGPYFRAYFARRFHPWQHPAPAAFERWRAAFAASGDPIAAMRTTAAPA